MNKLDKMSKLLNINLRYLIKGGIHFYSSNLINISLRLVLSIFLIRLLTKDIYGKYGFIFSVIGIISLVSLPGLTIAMKREVVKGNEYSFITATKKRFLYGLIGIVTIWIVSLFFFIKGDMLLAQSFLISSLFFIPHFVLTDYQHYFIGKKDFKRASWWFSINFFLSTIILIVALFVSQDIRWIIFISLFIPTLINIIMFFKIKKKIKIINKDKGFIKYGKNLTVIELISLVALHIDKLIILYFTSFIVLATYLVATIIPTFSKEGMKLFSEILFPKFVTEETGIYEKFKKKLLLVLIISLGTAIIGWIVIPFLLPLIYSEKYLDAVLPAQILIVGMALTFLHILINSLLQAQGKQTELYKISLFAMISKIVLLLILVPLQGLLGAAIAVSSSRILLTIYSGIKVGGIMKENVKR